MKKIPMKHIGVGFISLFILMNLFFGLTPKLNSDKMPGIGKWRVLSVLTGSMTPMIDAGDMVIVARFEDAKPAVGDVVTFWQDQAKQSLITHRVTQRLDNGFLETKGDANHEVDGGWTPPDLVVGKVVMTLPYAANLQKFIQHPFGYITVVLLCGYFIYRDKKRKEPKAIPNVQIIEEERI
ncbi:signal peptidase I [Brevibacillus ginsengisoli]|uniref:signal peptidase I n=1 Tax=Brevibacillus ginsengisoli TaxID=363854 RepID=UPI003CF0D3BE